MQFVNIRFISLIYFLWTDTCVKYQFVYHCVDTVFVVYIEIFSSHDDVFVSNIETFW